MILNSSFFRFLCYETVRASQVIENNEIEIPKPITAKLCFQVMFSSKLQLNICVFHCFNSKPSNVQAKHLSVSLFIYLFFFIYAYLLTSCIFVF